MFRCYASRAVHGQEKSAHPLLPLHFAACLLLRVCLLQYFGQVTYMDEESVQVAVDGANQTRWQSSVIVVEPHHRAHLAQQAGR